MSKTFKILTAILVILLGTVFFLQYANVGVSTLWNLSEEGTWLFPLVTLAALLDSVNPCAFSILLLTVAFLLSMGNSRLKILKLGAFYILGIFVTYILIGLGIMQIFHLFSVPHFMGKLGSALLVLLGMINLLQALFPQFPIRLRIPQAAHHKMASLMEKTSLPAVFMLGMLVGLCEIPCTGGPYLMVLGLLYDQGTYGTGLGYLIYYNLLFILPLILILWIASEGSLLGKIKEWKSKNNRAMRFWSGLIMVLLGILILYL